MDARRPIPANYRVHCRGLGGDFLSFVHGAKEIIVPDRGIRNNNPGNIRHSRVVWKGESVSQTDPDFVQFISPQYGLRAIVKILQSYQAEGIATIRAAISRWAPPSDNNPTDAYVDAVCRECSVAPDDPITFTDHLPQILKAIVLQENGSQPYPDDLIALAIGLAE